ncbi:MAG: hypothetical protein KKB31_02500, partial [Nanoarchaeota archaeon]|nr:hypothetical protein [Nanoarchaeota archaeon]
DSVSEIKGMPERWRRHIRGELFPDLSGVDVVSGDLYLWVPKGRRLKAIFSRLGVQILESKPIELTKEEYPEWLKGSAEIAYRVVDPVVETRSLLSEMAKPNLDRIVYSNEEGMEVGFDGSSGRVSSVYLPDKDLRIHPESIILTAGRGNRDLSRRMGIGREVMQERPLRQVIVRGDNLPIAYGHCIDISRKAVEKFPTLATITTHPDPKTGGRVWNIGGKMAEEGVSQNQEELFENARKELPRILAGVDFSGVSLGYFDTTRAEIHTESGDRPKGSAIYNEGNVYVAFPTKLSLAPSLADRLEAMLVPPKVDKKYSEGVSNGEMRVADYPW